MNMYKKHYKITSLIILALMLACFAYLEDQILNHVSYVEQEVRCYLNHVSVKEKNIITDLAHHLTAKIKN
ncbi:hypothetical protein [Fulvivirga lutea]|uniref:Uncharacterized protein n=1 Tax=Fulvivirga lutea TaxID=2810512 RepID=A0A974WHS3_9BACT|nr:hypothetical protein [Fulvivirga lutea]QSE98626.1 hypothetical protein JR347_05985 [Fulvivirga lutea]